MNTKHTPGPWAIETVKRLIGDSKETYDSLCVTFASPLRAKLICELGADTLPDNPQNARLIAAAPDLLAALKDILSGWRYIRQDPAHLSIYGVGWDRAQKAAEAAIAKSEGKA